MRYTSSRSLSSCTLKNTFRNYGARILLGTACIMLFPSLASAQNQLEEVVVTAERRVQSLQDVPISATVLSGDDLVRKGIDNLDEIQQVAPSLAISTYNRSAFVNIRGVGIAQSAPTSNPGVAYYIDGIYIPHEQFIRQSFYDIGNVEVLRGPQGTLTGQNSTGGAIYVTTPEPEYGRAFGYLDQTFAEYNWFRTVGAANIPLGDNFAMRLAAIYETRDSFTDNIGPSPSEPGNGELFSIRNNFQYEPTSSQKYNLRVEVFDYNTDYNAIKNRNDAVTSDPFTIEEDAISFYNQKGFRLSGEARIDLTPGIQFRTLVSYQDGKTEDQADGDRTATAPPIPMGLPASGANRAMYPGRVSNVSTGFDDTWMAEVNFLSTDDGPFQWVVGAFFLNESIPVKLYRDNYHTTDFVSSNSDIETKAENTSVSGFGQINYRFTDALELIAGVRYSDDKQDYTRYILPGPPPPGCFPCTTTQSSTQATGRVGINFYATDEIMLYATASKGYKAGGVNLDPRQGFFEPEKNFVYEGGVKSTLMNRHLRVNGDVFYSDYKDIQLSSLRAIFGPPLPVTENASTGQSWGAELEITGVFDRLQFSLGMGYLDAEFADDVVLNNTIINANELVPEGRVLPFSPKLTMNAGMQYDFDVAGMVLTPRLQYSHTSTQYATPFPGPQSVMPTRDIVDFRLTLEVNDNFTVEGFVTNLFDETYIASQVQDASSADGGIIYGAPQQFGFRGRYSFN